MPETRDWTAASQTKLEAAQSFTLYPVAPASDFATLAVGLVGQQVVIAGLDLAAWPKDDTGAGVQDTVLLYVEDSDANLLAHLAVSPGTPFASLRPPFGALLAASGADIVVTAYGTYGTGKQTVSGVLYYYYQRG